MKKWHVFILMIAGITCAQTGKIRGIVIDKQSDSPLLGATVELLNASEKNGVITDENGTFLIQDVAVGRRTIRVSFLGYESTTLSELEVTTGKDVILRIALVESFNELEAVVVTVERSKAKAINTMSAVSTRQFSTEEVNRYAGGRSDVARLATNFAGVATADDSRNDIIVRGNAPTGLLWRLEGIPIPSPNHFSTLGTTGAPVSALNPNLLANSDFMTSAFAAEYGNALGGVFDLGFRKGNTEDYEFLIGAAAFPGFEAMAEGPLGSKGGSFLVSARYGFVGVTGLAGTAAQPNYHDISYNIDLGNTKLGRFSLFGIYGNSDIELLGKNYDPNDLFAAEDQDAYIKSRFGAFGLKNQLNLSDNSYLRTILGYSYSGNSYKEDRIINFGAPEQFKVRFTEVDNLESRFTVSSLYNHKVSRKFTFRTGILVELFNLDAKLSDRESQSDLNGDGLPDFVNLISTVGNYNIIQPYAQGQYRLTEKIVVNAGMHGQYFSVNEQFVIEPRVSTTYNINSKNSITLGYGMHHQNVVAPILFLNEFVDDMSVQTNRNLDLVRNQHFVIGYDLKLASTWRAKFELYYQSIDKAAVERSPSSYSSLTEGADFVFSTDKTSLVSKGTGLNQGFEMTIEKFFSDGYHALITTSLFESKYKGSDGIERNSPFNNGYVVNILGGKEFKIGKTKQNTFSINSKLTTAGGRYFTPVNLEASIANGFEIRDDENAFSEQFDPYFRLDIRFGIQLNSKKKKRSHQFYVDFQNVTNNRNVFSRDFNRLTQRVDQVDQLGFAPDFGYRFTF